MHDTPTHDSALDQTIATLQLLDDETRRSVLEHMKPELRQRIDERMMAPEGATTPFSRDIAARRELIRNSAARIQQQRIEHAHATGERLMGSVDDELQRLASGQTVQDTDPMAPLQTVHPAALARAMQGERAEAWAIVLDHLPEHTRTALEAYLDVAARTAILNARRDQGSLNSTMLSTIQTAIASTVVPRALREHQILVSNQSGA